MPPSLARNSFARLASDVGHLTFSFASGVITARWFEPAGKGTYAALVSLVSVFAAMSSLGLGDAAVILIGRGEAALKRMVRVLLPPIVAASLVGAVFLMLVAYLQLDERGPTLGRSVLLAALVVPLVCLWQTLSDVANAREMIVQTSIIRVVVHGLTLVGLFLFVVIGGLHITGGMLALAVSGIAGVGVVAYLIKRIGGEFGPAWDWPLLGRALRLGLVIQLAHSLLALAARVDVLFVYSISGRAAAGRYSVALTAGQMVAFASLAVSFALFPRIARVTDEERFPLIAKASRVGLAMSILSGLVLLIVIPVAIPFAFGTAYRPSVLPALILLIGGVFWAEQNLLARARTAGGRTRLQLAAYGTTLAVMVVLDLLLIPRWGVEGAAIASALAPAAGLFICIASYRRDAARRGVSLGDLLPKIQDFLFLFRAIPGLIGRGSR